MNDLKAAIDYFNEMIDGLDEFLGLRLGDKYKHFVQRVVENKAIHQTALSALREKQERGQGCKYCAINDWERKPLATFNTYFNNYEEEQHEIGIDDYEGGYRIASTLGNSGPSVDIRFCPSCGRPLGPVGNADTLPTAEHSSGVEEPTGSKTERVEEERK